MVKRKSKKLSPESMRFLQAENPIGYNMEVNKEKKSAKKPRYESDNMKAKNPRSKGR